MPGRDGTGPMGQAMTGRGFGFCAGVNAGYGAGFGRGYGRGMGFNAGFGNRFRRGFGGYAGNMLPESTQKQMLAEQKALLQNRLEAVSRQLENLSVNNNEK